MAQEHTPVQWELCLRTLATFKNTQMTAESALNIIANIIRPAPPQYAEDVVDGMIHCIDPIAQPQHYSPFMRSVMSAALGVVLDRVCGPFTHDECKQYNFGLAVSQIFSSILAHRRASLLKPVEPTLEEEFETYLKRELNIEGCETAIAADLIAIVTRRVGGSHE